MKESSSGKTTNKAIPKNWKYTVELRMIKIETHSVWKIKHKQHRKIGYAVVKVNKDFLVTE